MPIPQRLSAEPRPRPRFPTRPWVMLVVFWLAWMPAVPGAGQLNRETLDSLLHEAVRAFSSGDYTAAAERFEQIEETFGSEPVFQEGGFLRRILPLKGYAEFQSGVPDRAVATFGRYLERFGDDRRPNAFVLYHLAAAHRRNAQPDEALRRFRDYREYYPDRREAALAVLQQAEILFEQGREEEGLTRLREFAESDASPTLRSQGRLLAVRRALDTGRTGLAARLLLDREWPLESVPEVAALTFTAIEAADALMEEARYGEALRAYRLALPRGPLIELQKERLEALRAGIAEGGGSGAGLAFRRNLHRRLQRRLAALEEAEDHTPSLTFRRGRALLFAERPREAWLVFESLALDTALGDDLRENAHYHWILAANALEEWEEALTIARNFTRRYGDSALAPRAFYLIARAHSEQRRYPEAIEVLTDLLDRFPENPLAQRWYFTRGFSFAVLERFTEARRDFQRARDGFPQSPLTARADLWNALTRFFEQDYSQALAEFDRLAAEYRDHPLSGEILYRRAATLYARGDFAEALDAAREFTSAYPLHERHGEALVLTGDILMGRGDLEDAVAAFQAVPPEAGSLYAYAVFQTGKVLRALGNHAALVEHFENYLDRGESSQQPRTSEALYWIGWAHTQTDRPEAAFPLFLETLERHGDDRNAGEIRSILTALEDLHRRLRNAGDFRAEGASGRGRVLLAAADFTDWLEIERDAALRDGRPTWYARLTRELADRRRSAGRPETADALLLEIVSECPPETLDAACLASTGHFLRENGLSAGETHLRRLLEDFPDAPERGYAYYGLARIASENGEPEEALLHLRRFHSGTPDHPLAIDAGVLRAELLRRQGDPAAAREAYEALLQNRAARGRPQAKALRALAEIHRETGEPEKAVAYYQRIYTLYRAYGDLVEEAYYESALLFEELGDLAAARNTLRELTELDGIEESARWPEVRDHEARLQAAREEDPER